MFMKRREVFGRKKAGVILVALALILILVLLVHQPQADTDNHINSPSPRAAYASNATNETVTELVGEWIEGNRSAEDVLAQLAPLLAGNTTPGKVP